MPGCCVPGCSERSEKGIRLFLLPQGDKNKQRRAQWIINIKRADPLPIRAYVCEKHFTIDQFENNRVDNKRPLRWNAIPTIFFHKKVVKTRKLNCSADLEESTNTNFGAQETIDGPEFETSANKNINPENKVVWDLRRKLKNANRKISTLTKELESLKKNLSFFGEDQIHYLKHGTMQGKHWDNITIKKSLQLYLTCGTNGYKTLRSQHYPLPCIRILQKKVDNF